MIVDLLIVVILVVLNGLLAMSELAVVSSRRSRLQALANRGDAGAGAALALAENPGQFLSAVQIGITLIGLIAGVFSGTSIAGPLADRLESLGIGVGISDAIAFGGVVTLVTYLSLVIGELVPKQLALRNPEATAALVAPGMAILTRICWPLVVVLEISSRTGLRWIGSRQHPKETVSREEIRVLIAEAESAGVMAPEARSMVTGALRLADRKVRTIMTVRDDVDWIDMDQSDAEIRARIKATPHSRLPVAHGSIDTVRGVLRSKDLLDSYLADESPDPRGYVEEAPTILDTFSALQAMEVLRSSGVHLVLIVDEYGVFQGLITTTNILEAIAGAFPIAGEARGPTWTRRDDGSWLFDGDLPVDEMAELVGVLLPPGHEYHTVAGFMLAKLKHIPATGESFLLHDWRFEVVDMDERRIDKVLATRMSGRRPRVR